MTNLYLTCRRLGIRREVLVGIVKVFQGVIAEYDRSGVAALKTLLADDSSPTLLISLADLADEEAGHA